MRRLARARPAGCPILLLLVCMPLVSAADGQGPPQEGLLQEIVVTAERRAAARLEQPASVATVSRDELERLGAKHVHEILLQSPGSWISRGSGQEHLTAIRSPVLTGAGSCGAFLVLEDGIPIRPSGFCNVNQLFEVFWEEAQQLEVIRGPGNALYGSNALHGILNFLMPALDEDWNRAAIELGANDYRRVSLALSDSASAGFIAQLESDGGFREDSGFDQQKLHGRWQTPFAGGRLTAALSASRLDQETAGFILGEDAYLDPALNRSNPNPEAFRKAHSARLYAIWQGQIAGIDADIRPYLRHNDMEFLQHFLPGQPLEQNEHVSAGVSMLLNVDIGTTFLQFGTDVEWSDVALLEDQASPTVGSPFLVATRPEGLHYDFQVTGFSVAPYVQWQFPLSETLELQAGVRAEWTRYDYDNRMLDGNTRDDGTACDFGGCLYTRPSDRNDTFNNLAPKFSLLWRTSDATSAFAQVSRGFRAPQMTELYRLQNGQTVSDLESETLDQVELGWRYERATTRAEIAAFSARKRDSVLRDSEGFNVSRGRSRHHGVELQFRYRPLSTLEISTALSVARHRYDFDLDAAQGESFRRGNDVDTAPRRMASVQLQWSPAEQTRVSVDWSMLSDYYLDAENQYSYPGHRLLNLTVEQSLSSELRLSARLRNVLDELVADRADFAFGNFRYFPGRGRELFIELAYRPDQRLAQ